eukprot:jgi/Ulvmu1/47/UM001_0050.1
MQDEIQQAEATVEVKQSAIAFAKACRLELLVCRRVLHRRCINAAAQVLRLLRAEPTGVLTPDGSAPTSTASAAAGSGRHANDGSSKVVSAAAREPGGEGPQRHPEASTSQPQLTDASAAAFDLVSNVIPSAQMKPVAADAAVKGHMTESVYAGLYIADILYEPESEMQRQLQADDGTKGGGMRRADATAAKLIREARAVTLRLAERKRQAAVEHGLQPRDVRWVLQSIYAAEDGRPLSFTSAMLSPQCMASLYACHFAGLLEQAMIAKALQQFDAAAGDTGAAKACSIVADAIAPSSACDGAACVSRILSALDTALAGVGDVCTFPMHHTCGVDGTAPVATTVPHISESMRIEAVPLAPVRARAKQVFTFCDLIVSQCMTDQPIAFRQMICACRVRAINQRGLQAEREIVLSLFRQMQLSHAQQRTAASMWRAWRDMRSKLDVHFANALMPLAAILRVQDVILEGSPHSHGHSVRSVDSMDTDSAVYFLQDGKRRRNIGDGGRVCICGACAKNVGGRLLGATGHITASVDNAMRRLAQTQRREAVKFVELLRIICMPDALFTTEQYAQQTAVELQQGAIMDWYQSITLWLCKTAMEHLEREGLFESEQRGLGFV